MELDTMTNDKTIDDVKDFWENNPLFQGESRHQIGSREYFDDHRQVVIGDCFAGELETRLFPSGRNLDHVLDLGCGPGFWSIELLRRGARQLTSADLTEQALELTRRRAELNGFALETSRQNAEAMTFPDGVFSHVNCQGVIHHTPDTEACVREIARVLRPDGTALISVYYRNAFIRSWPALRLVGKLLSRLGGGLKGRGREDIFSKPDSDEIVRLYDGIDNPIGKSYSKAAFTAMIAPHFEIEEIFFHFFPARALPVRIPHSLHRFLDRHVGFMIYARCRKRQH